MLPCLCGKSWVQLCFLRAMVVDYFLGLGLWYLVDKVYTRCYMLMVIASTASRQPLLVSRTECKHGLCTMYGVHCKFRRLHLVVSTFMAAWCLCRTLPRRNWRDTIFIRTPVEGMQAHVSQLSRWQIFDLTLETRVVDAAGRVMINDGGRLCKAHFWRPRNVNNIIHNVLVRNVHGVGTCTPNTILTTSEIRLYNHIQ
jgi:hypothetical protein